MITAQITEQLLAFNNPEDSEQLTQLDENIQRLTETGVDEAAIAALIGIFERFPDHDGSGVFWTIIHALESFGGYETILLRSVTDRPSSFTVRMINRLLNSNIHQINGIDLLNLLENVANNPNAHPGAQADAQNFIEYQTGQ